MILESPSNRSRWRLTSSLPNAYIISKFGGDKFVLLFDLSKTHKNITCNEVGFTTRIIQTSFMQPFHYLEQELYIKASIRITIFNDKEAHNVDLLQQAELALYHAKAPAKNTHRFFDQKLQLGLVVRINLENDLSQAIFNRELFSLKA